MTLIFDRDVSFFSPIRWEKGQEHPEEKLHWIGAIVEPYFDLGQQAFLVQNYACPDGIPTIHHLPKRSWCGLIMRIMSCALKIFSYATVVLPAVMFLAKCVYRCENTFVTPSVETPYAFLPEKQPVNISSVDHYTSSFAQEEASLRPLTEENINRFCAYIEKLRDTLEMVNGDPRRNSGNFREALNGITARVNGLLDRARREIHAVRDSVLVPKIAELERNVSPAERLGNIHNEYYCKLVDQMLYLGIDNFYNENLHDEVKRSLIPQKLNNLGNSCYLNAFLQCLANAPDLVNAVNSDRDWGRLNEVRDVLRELFTAYHDRNEEQLNGHLQRLRRALYDSGLYRLDEDGTEHGHSQVTDRAVRNGRTYSEEAGNERLAVQNDPGELFPEILSAAGITFNLQHRRRYTHDGVERERALQAVESSTLSIPIRNERNESLGETFQDLLNHYFSDSEHEDNWRPEDGISVDRFREKAFIEGQNGHTPELLVVNLNRWNNQLRKLNDSVDFPPGDVVDFSSAFDSERLQAGQSTKYQLVSVACHEGDVPNGGHYSTHVRRGDKWYRCDDNVIAEMPHYGHRHAENGYFYFFRKVSG